MDVGFPPCGGGKQYVPLFTPYLRDKNSFEIDWSPAVRNSHGPAPDDILLGEFNGKLDSD